MAFLHILAKFRFIKKLDSFGSHAGGNVTSGIAPVLAVNDDIERIEPSNRSDLFRVVKDILVFHGAEGAGEVVEIAVREDTKGDVFFGF